MMSSSEEYHETPLVYRLLDEAVCEWLDSATQTALASRGSFGWELAERKGIEEMRHLHLDGYKYSLVPTIIAQLRNANLLK